MRRSNDDGPAVTSRIRAGATAGTAVTAAAAAVSLLLLAGCGKATGSHDATGGESGSPAPTASPSPSVNPSYGALYLDDDECAAPAPGKKGAYLEVPCDDARATAQVTLRLESGSADPFSETVCAPHTDFVINVPVSLALLEDQATGAGYACMRNLRPPHPGDPGGGGGPRIEVGDCVHSDGKNGDAVEEVACRTKGRKNGATHKIFEILKDQVIGGFTDPCGNKADAVFTENPLFDSDPIKNDRVLCAKKL
ncbi:hypothetical protein [Streptomyces sp. PTD5-9]|uniref:hypothetical protein n=1 Tax=Streptomyces sp. PTD5-9 TaxID=3120150 RepID=UPI003008423C